VKVKVLASEMWL